jgi:rhodanese-related sulfurtransferase
MKKTLFLLATTSTLMAQAAFAECPRTLPMQFYQDCIITEGAGDTFPSPDYAYLEQYMAWKAKVKTVDTTPAREKVPANISVNKKTQAGLYLTSPQAYEHILQGSEYTTFIDIRTPEEVQFLGMPTPAHANIPYMQLNEWKAWDDKKNQFLMEVNADFIASVERLIRERGLAKSDAIILICRSGDRSAKAADLLAGLGYTTVFSVLDGYEGDVAKTGAQTGQRVVNGWKNNGLPWSYRLDKTKMYSLNEG